MASIPLARTFPEPAARSVGFHAQRQRFYRLLLWPSLLLLGALTLLPSLGLIVTSLTPLDLTKPLQSWSFARPLGNYRLLLEEDDLPVLYHCTTGKDRTGWATAALLTLLGVSEEHVYREYLLTNEQLLPALEPLFTRFEAHGAPRELLVPVLGVDRSYLDESFRALREAFGTIEAYFSDGLGITPSEQELLRERLLTDD